MATSRAFLATIPECSDEALGKLHSWAKTTSVKSDIIMQGDVMKLICIRREPKTLRELQRLLRTLLVKWSSVDLPSKMVDWIQLIDPEQYDEIKHQSGQGNAELDPPETRQSHKEIPADEIEESTEEPSESPLEASDPPRASETNPQTICRLHLPANLLKDNGALFVCK